MSECQLGGIIPYITTLKILGKICPFFPSCLFIDMNYSITESRLNQIIDTFISNQIGMLKKHIHPSSSVNYYWWTDKYDNSVFEFSGDDDPSLGVYEKLWESVRDLFDLSPIETDESFLRWAYHHMGMEFEDGIYTFERD
jgi:hypothetical protein